MRLLLLPLGHRSTVLYCQQLLAPHVRAKPRLDDRIVGKVAEAWEKFQKSPSSWKQQLTRLALRILDTVPFEEHCLRSVPPYNTWMRKLARENAHVPPLEAKRRKLTLEPIDIVYPPLGPLRDPAAVECYVTELADRGLRLHRQRMLWCAIGLPLTLPFALIPVLPNVPGIYVTYRLWCHWKAWQGAKHLKELVAHHQLRPRPLAAVTWAYDRWGPDVNDRLITQLEHIFCDSHLTTELRQAQRQLRLRASQAK